MRVRRTMTNGTFFRVSAYRGHRKALSFRFEVDAPRDSNDLAVGIFPN